MNALEYVPVPAFEDNYIWVVSDGRHAVVVDPGEAAPVRAYLAKRGWRLSAILLTHHHQDHVGGVADLLNGQAVPVYGPAGEAIEHVTQRLKNGDRVNIAEPALEFSVLDVPGHTSGHIAYFQAADLAGTPHVFCGDTLFACGCGRLFEGTPAQMLASLDSLAALPGATQVHCAHEYTLSNIRFALACEPGNAELQAWRDKASDLRARNQPTLPTTIAHERAVNPFLRAGDPAVQATLQEALHEKVSDRLAAFTLMREWKNRFC
ncbi:hydroxyacylglutathione hydrolase [bacterium M00.F.Ca.ET.228.01.1.1]|uniref:hydroxyacylglutathione hydrolase n=1 Tax=Paraburkholderia phenoliruptrix TaxID=252970 RepID=UPI00109262B6|nr:hydroxyacylglutathione hydrolase [Paraburkholderia phenoliruptrix]TGP43722.1 hydroxyacylglutathione hydrolase [bacterium M00.F.Ca.ET.228.01.1.1]TGS01384.1 hydroxyacylglutathione hydrolase [bacterium M00.F.Ca.ET.191.01.1.1]TGU09010.1 hydroxyacylglutathione hydrolase [bacterium M00.F.Ca.ET.155.01.1.1]MBW0449402.1 hydroxyacylglutathione hydrolase [Paraburkholderia phenoliruptrix]MBW9097683.1 hydroxyacylglutathione hydrolase [Paraburkholderia phenoliruptrix]